MGIQRDARRAILVIPFHAVLNATSPIEVADYVTGGVSQLLALLGLPLVILGYDERAYLVVERPEPSVPGRRSG